MIFGSWLFKNSLFKQVIFRDGEGALQVFPSLVGVIPEARLNLVIYHLRQGRVLLCVMCVSCDLSVGFLSMCHVLPLTLLCTHR